MSKKLLVLHVSLSVLLFWGSVPAQEPGSAPQSSNKQDGELQIQFTEDGYKGTFKTADQTVQLEDTHPSKDVTSSFIHANGRDLVKIYTTKEMLELTIDGVKMTIDLKNPAPMNLTSEEKEKLDNFRKSDDAKLIRKITMALVKERKNKHTKEEADYLTDFTVIGMFLGADPKASNTENDPSSRSLMSPS